MKIDRLTSLARGAARSLRRRLHAERPGVTFRCLSTCWGVLRYCHLRLFRRQRPLMIVLDGPAELRGFGSITGWAISRDAPVTRVEAILHGEIISSAAPTTWRGDIAERFPHYRSRGPQGFRLAPSPERLRCGVHPLVLRAIDARGRVVELHTDLRVEDYRLADTGALPPHLRGSNREYQVWRSRHAQLPRRADFEGGEATRISVVMPVFKPDLRHLRAAVDSVKVQLHENWELCLCDDGSRQPELTQLLSELADSDLRIRLATHAHNRGIAAATNTAIGLATGEYVAFLDQDDELAPEALAEVAKAVQDGAADVMYSDWDRIDGAGCYVDPFFKPDWSPDLLTSMMYLAHLTVYRRAFLERVGLCRSEFDGTQDWELALRATAQTERIVHIPRVLYHWRLGGVSAGTFNRVCHERGRRALTEHVPPSNNNVQTTVQDGPTPCTFHVRYPRSDWPFVSILIPTRDNHRLLRRCLKSLRRRTDYPRYEIIVIDNGSRERGTGHYLRNCGERVLRLDEPFNHSRLNNLAARSARGEVLVLLNDDTEVTAREWLTALVEQAMRPEVGAVGAWLFHADERIQHAGIVVGLGPVAAPLHSGVTRDGIDRGTIRLIRNVSAVTGACLAIRRALYLEIGGLDEDALPTSFNDVDLCLRLRRAGYRIVQQPLARLYHHESSSRRIGDEAAFIRIMQERWGDELTRDPFWNPNLPHGVRPGGFAFQWQRESTDRLEADLLEVS